MGEPMMMHAEKCGHCGTHYAFPVDAPILPCHRCFPRDYWRVFNEVIERHGRTELVMYGMPGDRLQLDHTLTDGKRFFVLRFSHPSLNALARDAHERNVAEMMKLKAENTELLAENARLRRRLEKK